MSLTQSTFNEIIQELDQILEGLLEDNPWHGSDGRFPKGGKRKARMWSLYHRRLNVSLKKGAKGKSKYHFTPNTRKRWRTWAKRIAWQSRPEWQIKAAGHQRARMSK